MRKKVKIAFIVQDASRKMAYNKRKKGLLTKVRELSTLCGVPACAIIYGENRSRPETWPPSNTLVHRVISRFQESDHGNNNVDQAGFLQQRIAKAAEQMKKVRKENREMEMAGMMYRALAGQEVGPDWLKDLSVLDLTDLEWVINQTLAQVNLNIDKKVKKDEGGPMEAIGKADAEMVDVNDGGDDADSEDHLNPSTIM